MIWLSSDQHYHHRNVIRLCSRPFTDVEDMHAQLISNWNALVQKDDLAIILGDFVFGKVTNFIKINEQLNGRKVLLRGNHDDKRVLKRLPQELGFYRVFDCSPLVMAYMPTECGQRALLSHYPYSGGGDSGYQERFTHRRFVDQGEILLHGHVHGAWRQKGRMLNVGVDVWGQKPVSLLEINELLGVKILNQLIVNGEVIE